MTYPKGEIVWVLYYSNQELCFLITSKPNREYYILYKVVDGKFQRLGKSKSPLDLESKFNVSERLSG